MKALLLAAGGGRRAGGPKAWLLHDGRPLLESQLAFLLTRFRPEEIFVSVQTGWLSRCAELQPSVRWIAAEPENPALDSLLRLLKVASAAPDWAFLYHVDMPVWQPALFDALAARAGEAASCDAVVPEFNGKRGHPVLLSPDAQEMLQKCDPGLDRLDHWLRARKVEAVETSFSCILENWNAGPTHAS